MKTSLCNGQGNITYRTRWSRLRQLTQFFGEGSVVLSLPLVILLQSSDMCTQQLVDQHRLVKLVSSRLPRKLQRSILQETAFGSRVRSPFCFPLRYLHRHLSMNVWQTAHFEPKWTDGETALRWGHALWGKTPCATPLTKLESGWMAILSPENGGICLRACRQEGCGECNDNKIQQTSIRAVISAVLLAQRVAPRDLFDSGLMSTESLYRSRASSLLMENLRQRGTKLKNPASANRQTFASSTWHQSRANATAAPKCATCLLVSSSIEPWWAMLHVILMSSECLKSVSFQPIGLGNCRRLRMCVWSASHCQEENPVVRACRRRVKHLHWAPVSKSSLHPQEIDLPSFLVHVCTRPLVHCSPPRFWVTGRQTHALCRRIFLFYRPARVTDYCQSGYHLHQQLEE